MIYFSYLCICVFYVLFSVERAISYKLTFLGNPRVPRNANKRHKQKRFYVDFFVHGWT